MSRLHVLTLCRRAVQLAHRHCPPLPQAGPCVAPRVDAEETLLLALLRTLWRLS